MKVDICKCVDCGRFVASVDNIRVGHKCSSRVNIIETVKGSHPIENKIKELEAEIAKTEDNFTVVYEEQQEQIKELEAIKKEYIEHLKSLKDARLLCDKEEGDTALNLCDIYFIEDRLKALDSK